MKKTALMCIGLLLLTACETENMTEGLGRLRGQPLSKAVKYLGYPDDKKEIAGKNIYIWSNHGTFQTTETVMNPYSGTAYGYGGAVNYSGTASSEVPMTYDLHCVVRLFADKKDRIEDWAWKGNEGCSPYSRALAKLIQDTGGSKKIK